MFVCANKCYKRLTKFEKIKKNLESLQIEIEEDFKKPSVFSSRTKRDSVITEDHTGRKKAAKFYNISLGYVFGLMNLYSNLGLRFSTHPVYAVLGSLIFCLQLIYKRFFSGKSEIDSWIPCRCVCSSSSMHYTWPLNK